MTTISFKGQDQSYRVLQERILRCLPSEIYRDRCELQSVEKQYSNRLQPRPREKNNPREIKTSTPQNA